MHLLRTALIVVMITLSEGAFPQADSVAISMKWNEGFIQLNDRSCRKGFIQYKHTQRLIKFKDSLNDVEELTFPEKRVLTMEYFDTDEATKRRFYTLNVREQDSGFVGEVLFEIIMEMKTSAVVSRQYAVHQLGLVSSSKRKNQFNPGENDNRLERIYIVNHDGRIELLATLPVARKDKSKPVARPVEPFLDQTVLKKFTGPKWKMVKAYVKEERLHLKKKKDLFKALEFFQQTEHTN